MVITTDNNNYTNTSYESYFKLFKHDLSPFQKHAIQGIVDGNHVLITASTGSGKTLPAEFAIQHFVNMGKRVIYCSPIKALSNQKTYDFTQKYPDITFGLLTGDIKTNPSAQVLIMTTEILMNQLFIGNKTTENSLSFSIDIENELGCVIFDEFHYINDEHRGHVWEQSILMLPPHIQMVMLSATLDDPKKSASWIESGNHKKQVVICSTDKRIVPLTHYIYMNGTEGLYKKVKDKETESKLRKSMDKCLPIRSADGIFNESTYREAKTVLDTLDKHDIHLKRKNVLNNLFAHLRDNTMLPAICFVFSRKAVEQCAEEITVPLLEDDSKVSYIVEKECESIIKRLPNWREYCALPEYQSLVKLLEKGIGIHHSGMIPVLREIVEFMISKKYIKVLFATESFAIGLDCPIKTAVFINLKKYDGGEQPRFLLPHEYTQMAGRAGRRGIDEVGHVVHCVNLFELPSMTTYKEVLCGKPQMLESKFKIYYSVVLNLFKNAETVSVEDIEEFISHSMMQVEIDKISRGLCREAEALLQKIEQKEANMANLKTSCETCKMYADLISKLEFSANKKRKEVEANIRKIIGENPNLEKDYAYYNEVVKMKKTLEETYARFHSNEAYCRDTVERLLKILLEVGMIEKVENMKTEPLIPRYRLVMGVVSEVNPILMAQLCREWNYFETFEPKDLVALLSVFTDVRINEECRIRSDKVFVKSLEKIVDSLFQLEEKHGIYMKDSGLDGLCYDLVEIMYDWCNCENAEDCRVLLGNIGISVGDFTKAVLKISTLARELMSVCENIGKLELMRKLSEVDRLILKYVATNQSLYL